MKKIINKYLNKHYYLSIKNGIRISDKLDERICFTLEEFIEHIKNIFGVGISKIRLLCEYWYTCNKQLIVLDLISYLNKCRVEMTRFDWVVIDKYGDKITLEKLIGVIANYDEGKKIVNNWFEGKQEEYLKTNYDFY